MIIVVGLSVAVMLLMLTYLMIKVGRVLELVKYYQMGWEKSFHHANMKIDKAIAEYYKPNTLLNAQMADMMMQINDIRYDIKGQSSHVNTQFPPKKSRKGLPKSPEHRKKISEAINKRNKERKQAVTEHVIPAEAGGNILRSVYSQDPGYTEA